MPSPSSPTRKPASIAEVEAGLPLSLFREQRTAARDLVRHTPLFASRSLSELCGGKVALKAENLQRTGSFKIRGALAKLEQLAADSAEAGVVAASAGNHGQALAYAARARGVRCRVYMPPSAAVAKVAAVEAFGGEVVLDGASVDECVELAREDAAETGATLVHPFDDLGVMSGQGTLGLELLEDASDLAAVIMPIGGGGLAGTAAMVLKRSKPKVHVVGVQVEGCAPLVEGAPINPAAAGSSLADGIAIKRPGRLTHPLIDRYVDELQVVSEDSIAEAMVLLLQRAKLVVEGAGAAALAALLSGQVLPAARGTTVALLSGGNVDAGVLSAITRRHETESGRRLRFLTRVPDHPGGLSRLLGEIARVNANLMSVDHLRDAVPLHVRETGIEVVLETRGADHSKRVLEALRRAGYEIDTRYRG